MKALAATAPGSDVRASAWSSRSAWWSKSALALLLVSVLLPAILFGLAAFQNRREVLRASDAVVDRTVRILQEHAVKVFETHRLVIDQVNLRLRFMDWTSEAARADIHGMLKQLQDDLDQVATITATDADGRMITSGRVYPADPSISFADRDWFQALRTSPTKLPFVSRSYLGRQSGQSVFNVAGPVNSPDGSFRGAVAVSVDRTYFETFYRAIEPNIDHTVLLMRGDGAILARDPPTSLTNAPTESPFFRWLRAGDPARIVSAQSSIDGVERMFGYRQVGEYPVYVGFSLTQDSALAPWRQNLRTYGLVAALAALALLSASGLAIRQSHREMIAAGELRRTQAQLADANADLEHTVAERTAELQDANAELQRYAYIVSHDLRAPLVNIMGFTSEIEALKPDLVAAGETPADESRRRRAAGELDEALSFIKAGIGKMDSLVNAILKLSRDGRRTFRPEPLDMTALVQSLADAQRHQADVAGAAVVVGPLPDMVADRLAVEQIFANLIDNAIKYLDPGRPGRIEVSGEAGGGRIRYRVQDNGRGIAASDHARVFDLFRRSGPQDRPGEGIGLAHVRAMVRSLGGRIDLASELGRGTTFTVTLPATRDGRVPPRDPTRVKAAG